MNLSALGNILLLFSIGLCGWALAKMLHIPVPALLGTIVVIGTLRAILPALPMPPGFLYPLVQVMLGLFAGARVTREASCQLKEMIAPILIILLWAVTILFVLGFFLSHVTFLDLYTAILSSSVAGLPEMTVIALATNADVTVVIIAQTFRMIITMIAFPLIFKYWVINVRKGENDSTRQTHLHKPGNSFSLEKKVKLKVNFISKSGFKLYAANLFKNKDMLTSLKWGLLTLLLAGAGGTLFSYLGVPAGAMVGAMLFVVAASLLGVTIKTPPLLVFGLVHIGIGIQVSSNISSKTVEALLSGRLLVPLLIVTAIIFLSSLLVAFFIRRVFKWDFPTSFLAAAPAGFSVMTALAIDFDKDPFRVSMSHLCRLLAVKTIVPFVFMFLLK